MSALAGEMLAITADQRNQLDDIQKDIDAHLDKLLTSEQINQATKWPPNTGGGPGFDPSRQPGQVVAGPEQNRLKMTDNQKKDLLDLQKAVDFRFEAVLTPPQKHQIKTVFAPFVPPPGGPRPGNPQQPGKIFSNEQQETLKLSPGQKKRLEEIQEELDFKLVTLLTADQRNQLETMQRRPPGGGPGGNGPPGGLPLFRALRYATSFPGFAGKDLKPGKSLEELQPKDQEKKEAEKKG
jgi:hypothetical protein